MSRAYKARKKALRREQDTPEIKAIRRKQRTGEYPRFVLKKMIVKDDKGHRHEILHREQYSKRHKGTRMSFKLVGFIAMFRKANQHVGQ